MKQKNQCLHRESNPGPQCQQLSTLPQRHHHSPWLLFKLVYKLCFSLQVEKKMSTISNPETFLSPQDLTTPAASVAASSIAGSQAQTLQMPSKDSSKFFYVFVRCLLETIRLVFKINDKGSKSQLRSRSNFIQSIKSVVHDGFNRMAVTSVWCQIVKCCWR